MLNKETFTKGIIKLKTFYPTWKLDLNNSDIIKAWYDMFNNQEKINDKSFNIMIDTYIELERYNPSFAGLMVHYSYLSDKPLEIKIIEVADE